MISASLKRRLRHVVLVGTIVSFVLLYVGAVTVGSPVLTGIALGVTGAVSVLAMVAF